jgi:uncharacterized protein (TIGR00106 family)
MPIMGISIIPLGTQTPSISKYVASGVGILKRKKIKYQLTPMATIVEAESLERLFDIAQKMHRKVLSEGVKRVVTTIAIDERLDKKITMISKVKSVKQKIKLK